jgi:Mn2+/Fe2+ NRAMP family transporter
MPGPAHRTTIGYVANVDWTGPILSDIVGLLIVIATAAAIGGAGPVQSARQTAEALVPAVGSGAPVLFGIGLLGASLLAAAVAPLSCSYAIAESVGAPRSVSEVVATVCLITVGVLAFTVVAVRALGAA